jgi:hypothetical protein
MASDSIALFLLDLDSAAQAAASMDVALKDRPGTARRYAFNKPDLR